MGFGSRSINVPWLVSTDGNQTQVNRSEFIANFFEYWAISRVSREENFLARRFDVYDVTAPQGTEIIQRTSLRPIVILSTLNVSIMYCHAIPMLCRSADDVDFVVERHAVPPAQFDDLEFVFQIVSEPLTETAGHDPSRRMIFLVVL